MTNFSNPPITTSIFEYPPSFPNGQVNDAWAAWFTSLTAVIVAGPVQSFNGRTGVIVPQSGDYEVSQITGSAHTWAYKASTTTGLTFGIYGGPAWSGTAYTSVGDTTVALTANSTNYVQRTPAGAVSANTTGWTIGSLPLYIVTTGISAITSIVDQRVPATAGSVVFQQTGTGAVAQTLDSKAKQTVSVEDFGAVGDGVTDDTAAFQATHDSLVSGGRILLNGSKNYVLNTVNISNSNIVIDGGGATITKKPGTSGYCLWVRNNLSQVNVRIMNLVMIGDPTVIANGGIAVATDNTTSQVAGLYLENITCRNFAQYGFYIASVSDFHFKNLRVENHGSTAVGASIGVGFILQPLNNQSVGVIDGLYSKINAASTITSSAAIKIQIASNLIVSNVHAINGTEECVSIQACNGSTFKNWIVESSYTLPTAYPGCLVSSNAASPSITDASMTFEGFRFIGGFTSAFAINVPNVRYCTFTDFDMTLVDTTVTSGSRITMNTGSTLKDSVFNNWKLQAFRLDTSTGVATNCTFNNIQVSGGGAFTFTGDGCIVSNLQSNGGGTIKITGNSTGGNILKECISINSTTNAYEFAGIGGNRAINCFSLNPTGRTFYISAGTANGVIGLRAVGGTGGILDSGTNTAFDTVPSGKRVYFGTNTPGAGTWAVGDLVYHSAPILGGNIGWVCVGAGTPGTWQAFGRIFGVGGSVASAATITPTGPQFPVSGTAAISTINLPYTGFAGVIYLFPTGVFTLVTGGNIAKASTAVVGQMMSLGWDGAKWNPSY